MLIAAVDPGLTTGVASYEPTTGEFTAFDTTDIDSVANVIDALNPPSVLVVEAFPGSGPRTTEAIHTLKLLGFVEHYARRRGLTVVVQQPQVRLHRGEDAKHMLGKKASTHMIAALAHALAYSARHPYDEVA